jgi:RNA polymerase sigma-70 factor (ECF subfamily)
MIINSIDERLDLLHIRSGRTEVFVKFYDRYMKEVYRYVSFKVGSAETAEDIVSDVFLRALEYVSDVQRPLVKQVRPFLYQLARAVVADFYRDRKPTQQLDLLEDVQQDSASTKSPDSAAEQLALQRALSHLPEDQREAVLLKHIEGLSAGEVGKIMERSAGAVRVLVHRGLERLRELMGDQEKS